MDRFKDRRGDRRAGMSILLDSKKGRWPDFDALSPQLKELEGHPFGFDLPKDVRHGGVHLLPRLSSDDSVRALATCVRYFIAGNGTHGGATRLRIFTIRPADEMAERQYLFEVWSNTMVFIGGDFTYFSGGGGSAMRDMRSVFLALSAIYNIDIEEELVLHDQLRTMDASLLDDLGLTKFVQNRRAA